MRKTIEFTVRMTAVVDKESAEEIRENKERTSVRIPLDYIRASYADSFGSLPIELDANFVGYETVKVEVREEKPQTATIAEARKRQGILNYHVDSAIDYIAANQPREANAHLAAASKAIEYLMASTITI